MSVIVAVRISMSIPIIFTPVLYNSNYYIDGGVVNNFPINYCNSKSTLGLCININQESSNKLNLIEILNNVINILVYSKNTTKNTNVIYINKINNSSIDYNITYEEKIKLINHGETTASKFINNFKNNLDKSIFIDKFIQTD